jgi:hypothetical protein
VRGNLPTAALGLLVFLLDGKSRVAHEMMYVGFGGDEMRDAWD